MYFGLVSLVLTPLLISLSSTMAATQRSNRLLFTPIERFNGSSIYVTDVVAIDPATGNTFKLGYTLPHRCLQIDEKRGLAYTKDDTTLYKVNLADGRLVSTYKITTPTISTYFTQWNYDTDTNVLYGVCLEPSKTALHWNYTW